MALDGLAQMIYTVINVHFHRRMVSLRKDVFVIIQIKSLADSVLVKCQSQNNKTKKGDPTKQCSEWKTSSLYVFLD